MGETITIRRSLWNWIKTHIEETIEDIDLQLNSPDHVESARQLLRDMKEIDGTSP